MSSSLRSREARGLQPEASRVARWLAGSVLVSGSLLLALTCAIGCEKKMDPAECDKIRADAFALLNKGQPCATDADCKEASYPQCRRPINAKNADELAAMEKKTKEGKCEAKAEECKDSPPVYCKQGLCANREPGKIEE